MKSVYIIHGWTYSTDKWNKLTELFKKNGIKPILLKVPGLTEEIDRVWTLNDYVEWLKVKLDKQKGKVILIGHSNGGRISLAFATQYPEKIEQLILIGSAGVYHNELSLRLKRSVFKGLSRFGKRITSSKKLKNLLYKLAGVSDYKEATANMRQTMLNLIQADRNLDFTKVTVPTTIIWGEKDRVTPLTDGQIISIKIKNSRLYIIDSARHAPYFTHPQEVSRIILKTIKS